ncbi:hypothetical protein NXS19_011373 [Fusarium pseudograminearum]|uniref:Uncharacterized protein n=1 Tax=Fusarium pseudograminearum (strain CS3096) TaxID=1028729 RepID=K3V8S0_FUSPC|nr:hypothetical protein FPSE_10138 [Fusarium pseudograminearum CS3096]EKJ69724.1 hypothetical protein FPSE_10138 [Fusarium pseudograminearum CS3096]KAF0645499.1 hypothetical protein FPSE5266_10138 [Fusarium pseudograminearum]QPC74454.1 hypothetical protein HYE68_005206 [Fusarium pseudograminearum]UZP43561.1 hypothetical protein NXS19_011373 [Fusarium pseudograminearum]
MSTTVTSSAAAASASTACAAQLYNQPNQDNTCALRYTDRYLPMMEKCCGDAKIVSYYDDCGIYCVALDQTIDDLSSCLFKAGAADADVFCSGNNKTTMTKDAEVPATAQASVVSSKDDDDKDGDDKDSSSAASTGTATGTASSSSETSSETGNAAPSLAPKSGMNTVGLAIGALLFSSFAAGIFQL